MKWLEPADRLGDVFIGFLPRHIHVKLNTDVKLAVGVDVKDLMYKDFVIHQKTKTHEWFIYVLKNKLIIYVLS